MGNIGILLAAGLIAGEGLTGLLRALWKFLFLQKVIGLDIPKIFTNPSYALGLVVLVLMAFYLIAIPLKNAGAPDEPPPAIEGRVQSPDGFGGDRGRRDTERQILAVIQKRTRPARFVQ